VLALLFSGLVAYMFVPWPKKHEPGTEQVPAAVPSAKPPSKLAAYGLPDNPDLEQLPEMFAKFAERGTWVNNRVPFAYWHPGAQRFAYFFEAIRVNGSYRFRTIPEVSYIENDKESDTWPILFYSELVDMTPGEKSVSPGQGVGQPAPLKMKVELQQIPVEILEPAAPMLNLKPEK
jgi:hypothetical protein